MLSLRSDVFIIITNNTKQTIYFGFINIRLTPIFCGFRSSVDPRIQLFIEVRLETYDKTLPTNSHIPETVNLILKQQKLNLVNLNEIISTYPLLLTSSVHLFNIFDLFRLSPGVVRPLLSVRLSRQVSGRCV